MDFETDAVEKVMRLGWVARGASYAGAGLLAVALATGYFTATEEPTQKGALGLIGGLPLGQGLLFALALGLFLFAAWELVTVVVSDRTELLQWIDHAGKLIGVGFYAVLGFSALQAMTGSLENSGSLVNQLTRIALSYPLGRVVIAGAGITVIVVSLRRAKRIWTGDFDDSLEEGQLSDREAATVDRLGRAGEVGRSISLAIVGSFLLVAAWRDQGSEARGLDESLYALNRDDVGRWTVLVVGIGFVAYGLFCVSSAPARKLPSEFHD